MARLLADQDGFPLQEQIKALGNEELLDFWEETQYLEKFLDEEMGAVDESSMEYERLILQELQVRSCMGCLVDI